MSEDVEPTTASRLDGSEIARRVMDRAGKGEIDLRVVSSAMGEAWDQDFASAILRAALSTPAPADASGFQAAPSTNDLHCFACGQTFGKDCDCATPSVSVHYLRAIAKAFWASTPPRPIDMGEIEPLNCEELAINYGQQVSATFKDSKDAFALFNELRARQALAAIKGEGA